MACNNLALHTYLTLFISTLVLILYHLLHSQFLFLEFALLPWGPEPLILQLLIYETCCLEVQNSESLLVFKSCLKIKLFDRIYVMLVSSLSIL